jgi:ribosome-binding ATPase YchF (GTP1/OBG family)
VKARAAAEGAEVVVISAQVESEIAELDRYLEFVRGGGGGGGISKIFHM